MTDADNSNSESDMPPPGVAALILSELAKLNRSVGKMDGILSSALSLGKSNLQTLKEHAAMIDHHGDRLTKIEAQMTGGDTRAANNSVQLGKHGERLDRIERAEIKRSSWTSGAGWVGTTILGVLGGVLATVARYLLKEYGGQ